MWNEQFIYEFIFIKAETYKNQGGIDQILSKILIMQTFEN